MEQSYKEKYEDILARLSRAKNDNDVCDERYCCVIDEIIPELAESEDEKVRKEIVRFIQMEVEDEIVGNKWLAWLEKQKGNIGGISSNWSEEDSFRTETLISVIKSGGSIRPELRNEFVNWLKSLQDRVQPQPQPKYNFGDTELTQEELCEGLIRGMVDEHNRVTKEVLRNEYEKGRADVLAKIDAIDVDEMVCESGATSRVTQYWYAHGVNDVIKKLKEEEI